MSGYTLSDYAMGEPSPQADLMAQATTLSARLYELGYKPGESPATQEVADLLDWSNRITTRLDRLLAH